MAPPRGAPLDFLDPWYLLVSLVASCFGLGAFLYGKRLQDGKSLILGLVIMGGTYLIPNTWLLLGFTTLMGCLLFSDQIVRRIEGRPDPKQIPRIR